MPITSGWPLDGSSSLRPGQRGQADLIPGPVCIRTGASFRAAFLQDVTYSHRSGKAHQMGDPLCPSADMQPSMPGSAASESLYRLMGQPVALQCRTVISALQACSPQCLGLPQASFCAGAAGRPWLYIARW